jgi:3-hydroxyacyl-CoA dehydrogenase
MDWKLDLYTKIAPHIAPHAIVASNTSGLSITKLSEALPEAIKPRFCGIHFFNPPRYMYLVELIATPTTQPQILDQLEPSSPVAWARAWCAPRTRPTSSPTASASPACWPR